MEMAEEVVLKGIISGEIVGSHSDTFMNFMLEATIPPRSQSPIPSDYALPGKITNMLAKQAKAEKTQPKNAIDKDITGMQGFADCAIKNPFELSSTDVGKKSMFGSPDPDIKHVSVTPNTTTSIVTGKRLNSDIPIESERKKQRVNGETPLRAAATAAASRQGQPATVTSKVAQDNSACSSAVDAVAGSIIPTETTTVNATAKGVATKTVAPGAVAAEIAATISTSRHNTSYEDQQYQNLWELFNKTDLDPWLAKYGCRA
ncbi:hypothetical protein B0T22DRAFT_475824 [Podospora appendiculata]|uniref:Uncharacterized protein n=1 Tax=Podospora appendiculata TaxID=314037 RepID=A0AAE0XGQ1_9PEZI|nr:hypothetical protein B0T22DRAFT_475824 [Podospora appendiculata]